MYPFIHHWHNRINVGSIPSSTNGVCVCISLDEDKNKMLTFLYKWFIRVSYLVLLVVEWGTGVEVMRQSTGKEDFLDKQTG